MASGIDPTPLSPDELVELAEKLRDLGASSFSWGAVTVQFREGLSAVKVPVQTQEQRQAEPKPVQVRSIYQSPGLWPEGKPPTWPGPKAGD